MRARWFLAVFPGLLAMAGCTRAAHEPVRAAVQNRSSARAAPHAPTGAGAFAEALVALAEHDRAGDWTEEVCSGVAAQFIAAFDPPRAVALYDAGIAELRCGRDAAAIELVKRAAALDPESVPTRVLVAHLAALRAAADGDLVRAGQVLAAAIERDGAQELLLADLAQVHVARVLGATRPGSAAFDLAKKTCDEAIARMPRSARLFALRGALASKERRFAAARADFDRAFALDPAAFHARLEAGRLAARVRDFARAERLYRAALGVSPDSFEARLERAIALREQIGGASDEDYEESYRAARDAIAGAISAAPERAEGQLHFAVLLREYGGRRANGRGARALTEAYEVLTRVLEAASEKTVPLEVECRAWEIHEELKSALFCSFDRRSSEEARKAAEAQRQQEDAEIEAAGEDATGSPDARHRARCSGR